MQQHHGKVWSFKQNKSQGYKSNRLRGILAFGLLTLTVLMSSSNAFAEGTQTFTKELQGSATRNVGDVVTYELKPACNSLTGDCGNLTITDTLPAGMVIDSCTVPTGFTINSCAPGTSNIDITKDNAYDGGDSFVVLIRGLIELDADPAIDITNSATATITSPIDPANATVTADAPPIDVLPPSPQWSLEKVRTSPAPPLLPTWDTDVSYRVSLCSDTAVGNVSLSNVQLSDAYPTNAVIVNNGGAVANANPLVWDVADADVQLVNLYSGQSLASKQCITRSYTLRYPNASFTTNDQLLNTISATGTPDGGANGPVGTPVIIDEVIGIPTPGANLSKAANDVLPNEDLVWRIAANVNSSNAPIPDLVIYEQIPVSPAGVIPVSISSGQWNSPATTNAPVGSDVRATIGYSTDAGSCDAATYTALATNIASPASSVIYTLPATATCVRWEFSDAAADGPAVPRGWAFTNNPTFIQDTTAYPGPFPVQVQNCVNATYTEFDLTTGNTGDSCGTANIENETPEIILSKLRSANNLAPLDTTQFTLRFRHDTVDSTGATVNPVLTDLIPEEFEFISWDSVSGLGGEDEPNLEIIDNYNGTGRTFLRFSWSDTAPAGSVQLDGSAGVDNPASFAEGSDVRIRFTVRVKPGTLDATYTNTAQFFDNSPRFSCNSGTQVDTNDLDGDGNTTENLCNATRTVVVIQAAVIGGEKWVKGDLTNIDDPVTAPAVANTDCPDDGNGFTRFPCVAQTSHGGDFDYSIKIVNAGNQLLSDYILYDVLPEISDTGVGEPLSALPRGTVWRPELIGAVVPSNLNATAAIAQAGSIIEYSSSANACRTEVSATADESTDWQGGCVDDWTDTPADFATVKSFRIILPFGTTPWQPLDELEFAVQMRAPTDAPSSILDDAANFNPAWNSFAHRVTQDTTGSRLSTAEPRQVGIVLPPNKYRLGNLVWLDTNQDGNADVGEPAIPGVNVELWIDDDGTAGPSAGDTHVVALDTTTDINGHYSFDQIDAGDYYVVIPNDTTQAPLAGLASSSNGEELLPNNDVDNNDNGVTKLAITGGPAGLASGIVTLGPVTTPEPTNEVLRLGSATDDDDNAFPDPLSNLSVDFGFVPSVSIGSLVWNDTNNNGIQDNGELGIPGATVTLLDAGGDPVVGVVPQTTLADGLYYFEGLAEGNYSVRVTPPIGFLKSTTQNTANNDDTPNDSNIATTVGNVHTSGQFTLAVDGEPPAASEGTGLTGSDNADNADDNNGNMTVDFGFYLPVLNAVSIGSVVWNDTNNNGIQDISELGIPGAIVTLLDGSGTPVTGYAPLTTGADGLYYFGNLPEGDYQVQVEIPTGFTPTANQVADANTDADNDTNINTAASVGNVHKSGIVTLSNDGEPDGVTIDENGVLGGDGQDSIDDNNGNMTVDFGFYPTIANAVSIGSLVWDDNNDNGKQDDTEAPIAGAVVTLLDAAGIPVPGITPQTTGADGLYYFDNLPEGDYRVGVTPPVGYEKSSAQNTANNDDTDNDSNIASTVGNDHTSGLFTLSNDGEPSEVGGLAGSDDADTADEDNGNMTVDFGFKQPVANAVSIGSIVWNDIDFNGIQDAGEPGISGMTVTLLNSSGIPIAGVAAQTTGVDGLYYFGNLPQGDYQVKVTPPAGYVPTFVQESNADGDVNNDSNIAVASGADYISGTVTLSDTGEPTETTGLAGSDNADATAETNGNMTVDFGFVPTTALGGIEGNVSQDVDGDGLIDFIEDPAVAPVIDRPLEGVVLQLLDAAGQPMLDAITGEPITTITDANGNYSFNNLMPGDYQVFQVQPSGYLSVSDVDGDDQNDTIGDGAPISVTAGVSATANNFIERRDPQAIPTLSEWALILLTMLLGLFGYRQGLARNS